MAVGAQSYRPDPAKQEAAKERDAAHRDIDLAELSKFIDPDLIAYIDYYQTGVLDLRGCELPDDLDEDIAESLRNNTAMYDDETEDLLLVDTPYERLLKQPASEERSAAIRARRSVIILALLALEKATAPHKTNGSQVA
ncbi:hypothetical protein KC973_03100 [Candidatus Saccharibacteria bacterium]|nr:hypothetical protein [Candidatus Saccharibacteria bacterium]